METVDKYDDIIVGAGSAGSVIASRLSEDPNRRVLLLEAGPDYPAGDWPATLVDGAKDDLVSHDWKYAVELPQDRTAPFPRGRVVGGCSAVNGAIVYRGTPSDFEEWERYGLSAWSWDRVLPFFKMVEDDPLGESEFHGVGGPIPINRSPYGDLVPIAQAFVETLGELGFTHVADLNAPEYHPEGCFGNIPFNVRDGIRVSTAIGYLASARSRPNLTVLPSCHVDRVLIEDGVAVGIRIDRDGTSEDVRGERVTICTGTIGTPAVLIRSGVGPKDELEKLGIAPVVISEGVGRNLSDHAGVGLRIRTGEARTGSDPHVQVMLRYTAADSDDANDMQLYLFPHMVWTNENSRADGEALMPTLVVGLQKPHSRGRVTLRSTDARDRPIIHPNYVEAADDMKRMVEGVRLAARIAKADGMASVVKGLIDFPEEVLVSDEACEDFIRGSVNTMYHPVGTARMGSDDDEMAVVDQQLRVRGVENLRVADASVMPTSVCANTNLTCIMIGERAAAFMKSQLLIAQ